jgi:hypothetical protein
MTAVRILRDFYGREGQDIVSIFNIAEQATDEFELVEIHLKILQLNLHMEGIAVLTFYIQSRNLPLFTELVLV